MKTQKFEGVQQRKILTGMIVHDDILAKIHRQIANERQPFRQRWLDLVARWCLEFFTKYGKAPKKSIAERFAKYADTSKDADTIELVEKFLDGLNSDYQALKKDLNEDFIVDLATDHFRKVKLHLTAERIEAAVGRGDLEEAEIVLGAYKKVDASAAAKEDPFTKEAIKETFRKMEQSQSLIRWPGALEKFLSPYCNRSDFLAFVGPEKRGKSFWLGEAVWQAMKQRRRVLYYVFGDMSKAQIYQRLYCRAARRPFHPKEPLLIPKRIRPKKDRRNYRLVTEEKRLRGLGAKDVWEARNRLLQVTASNDIPLKIQINGGYDIAATDIERDVEDLANREGWIPDVVVIDYADLLKPEIQTKDLDIRHQINLSWAVLRRIALDHHCLVVTATQAAASSYSGKWVITKRDFSEDKRKMAHVTGMIGINQSEEEKVEGVYRLNWVVLRGGPWAGSQTAWTAGNLAISNPCMVSCL